MNIAQKLYENGFITYHRTDSVNLSKELLDNCNTYIKNKIKSTGYVLQIFQMSPHNYGVPQQRERVYFVCVRNDIYNNSPIVLEPYNDKPLDFTKN